MFDHVHRVTRIPSAEQECPGFAVEGFQQFTQLLRGRVIERFK